MNSRILLSTLGLLASIQPAIVSAQLCPYEPLGATNGETAACAIAAYYFIDGATDQSIVQSASGPASATFDGTSLFSQQIPRPASVSSPFIASSKIIAEGPQSSATGIRVEQRGRIALTPRASGADFQQTIAFESHARVTFTPFVPGDDSGSNVTVVLDFNQTFRLTDDAADGGDTGQANAGATVLLRNLSEETLAPDIAGSAFLNLNAGPDPQLWNAFETGGSSTSCGPACREVTVALQRVAEVPANQPVSVDAYTFGLAESYNPDAVGTVWSDDNRNTAVISISSSDADVRFDIAGELPALTINAGMNDAWYNPATNGQGFLMAVFPDIGRMFVAWFTYDVERPPQDVTAMLGEPGHRWLTAQGPYDGNVGDLTIYLTEGGVFDASDPAASNDGIGDGTMRVVFIDCATGVVEYEIPSLGLAGEIPIQRIVADNQPLCEALANP